MNHLVALMGNVVSVIFPIIPVRNPHENGQHQHSAQHNKHEWQSKNISFDRSRSVLCHLPLMELSMKPSCIVYDQQTHDKFLRDFRGKEKGPIASFPTIKKMGEEFPQT